MCPRDAVCDGHSVLLVGYRDDRTQPGGGVFLIRNSGGPSRDGMLSYEYVKAYMNDAIWIDDGHRSTPRPTRTALSATRSAISPLRPQAATAASPATSSRTGTTATWT